MKKISACFLSLSLIIPSISSAQNISDLQAQINSLLAMVAKLQAQISAQTNSSNNSFCYTFNKDLKVGDRGIEVAYLHTALERQGFSIPDSERPQKDGETINDTFFGEATASKVSAFQEKYRSEILTPAGLSSPTGYFGGRTRAKLNQLCINNNQIPPTNPITPALPVACTMDAKLCPDGKTYVGRTGPKCEFSNCPTTTPISNAKPDLMINYTYCTPGNPPTEQIVCKIGIINKSEIEITKPFDVSIGGEYVTINPPLKGWGEIMIEKPSKLKFSNYGLNRVDFQLDVFNSINESNENNNNEYLDIDYKQINN